LQLPAKYEKNKKLGCFSRDFDDPARRCCWHPIDLGQPVSSFRLLPVTWLLYPFTYKKREAPEISRQHLLIIKKEEEEEL